jgi:MarR family transcriptional regulator, organic hydroperoxide resistance regulator
LQHLVLSGTVRAMTSSRDKKALAARAWRGLFDFFVSTRAQRDKALERLDLTPNDARALSSLRADEGKTMRSLAAEWGTDASNVTWVVDRLEEHGLAKRQPVPGDRRARWVVLTHRGAKTKADLERALHEPPPELLALEAEDLAILARVFEKMGLPAAPG